MAIPGQEAVELAFKLGFESEKNRLSCSQSSFHAITTVLGYKNPQVFKSLVALQGGGRGFRAELLRSLLRSARRLRPFLRT